jgi:hypothetical protein
MAAPCPIRSRCIVLCRVAQFKDTFCCPTVIHTLFTFVPRVYFVTIRRASSPASIFAAERRGELLAAGVLHDKRRSGAGVLD